MTLEDEAELERELDRLYGLPLEEFTGGRNELARRARQEGQRAIGTRIGELSKPTLPAWVVNQLARRRELDVQRLVKAGEGLATAQADALGGAGADAFARARQEQQHALRQLTAAAEEILAELGRPIASNLDRVAATLRAASLTEEGRALLKRGRLAEELELTGFEAFTGLAIPKQRPRPAPPAKKPKPTPTPKGVVAPAREAAEAKRKRAAAAEEAEGRRKLATEARQRVRERRAELRDRETRLRAAERRASELRKQLEAAEQEASALEDERTRAERELAAAERELAELPELP
jgi:hypothetical protein